ncbi:MAG: methyltransferase domain-containing protein [Romboutsia sp.]|uniref:methyltransferase domain-containing protein n=1 Tax=Romboutsia sp. TaxID=1965302 RepID=UPI003F3A3FCA
MISVVVLSHNTNDTQSCIENIENNLIESINEIVIIKVNSDINYKSEKINIVNINDKDLFSYSFSKFANIGIKNASKENDVLILNDNCCVVEKTFENLEKALYSNENIGVVTPVSNIGPFYHYQSLNLPFESLQSFIDYTQDRVHYNESDNELRLRTSFLMVLIKRSVLNEIGLLDEKFISTDFASDDFCLRALQQGYKTLLCNNSFVYIKKDLYYNIAHLDKGKFKDKWGFDPLYSLSIRTEILDKLSIDASSTVNILEIGCACGSTLLKLNEIYKDCNLYGFDINKESTDIAKCIDNAEIKCADIESDDILFEENKFDLIILLDVLEHLKDPWKLMKKVKKALKKEGQIIISLPNIMHISIVHDLVQGKWDYQESGILDRTHLRFFTLKSIREMFQSIDCNMIYYFSIYSRISNEQENLINLLSTQYNIDKTQLMSYQYIITNKVL